MKKILMAFVIVGGLAACAITSCSKGEEAKNESIKQEQRVEPVTAETLVLSKARNAAFMSPNSIEAINIELSTKIIELELAKIEVEKAKILRDTILVRKNQKIIKVIKEDLKALKNSTGEKKKAYKEELIARGLPTCWGK